MVRPVSKKQYRYLMAILHDKPGKSSRGDRVPKSVAGKYDLKGGDKDLPESKGKEEHGGTWDSHHHEKAKARVEEARTERKKQKAKLRKAFEDYYEKRGVGTIVLDNGGHILLGYGKDGKLQMPGGHVKDNESFEDAARRELKEEAGLNAPLMREIGCGTWEGNYSKVFVAEGIDDKAKQARTDGELKNLNFYSPENIPWKDLRHCSAQALEIYFNGKIQKSLKEEVALEDLRKNIIRTQVGSDVVYQMTHEGSLKLVGTGTFKFLRNITKDMKDEDFREVKLDNYTISIRRHASDVYSGRVTDGHKLVHQWTNRSLPAMTAEIMSIFEWYSPKDEGMLESLIDENMPEDAIEGGLEALTENYRKHNISNIYQEMENIRTEVRNGMAVDLQQVEQRIMKLFDKLEDSLMTVVDGHNKLTNDVGDEIDKLHEKLIQLQSKIDDMSKKPSKIDAFSTNPGNVDMIHDESYPYLSKPKVIVHVDGRIEISFDKGWSPLERENFLRDMRATALKKGNKDGRKLRA